MPIVYNIKESRETYNKHINLHDDLSNDLHNDLHNDFHCDLSNDLHNEINDIVEEELKNNFNETMLSLQLFYEEYTKKELEIIADYYYISKRKKRKLELIQDIILFEIDTQNNERTQKRKLMWFYISEIESDSYLKKFIIFK
tara:strand:+ start:2349 stop:2774 length:426 start_codon:yes stop_codon:yes gene_type:complete